MSFELQQNLPRPYWLQFIFTGQGFLLFEEITVPASDTAFVQIKTGANNFVHIAQTKYASNIDNIKIEIIEAPTITDGTTPITPINLNRVSTNVSDITAFSDPTAVSGGTIIERLLMKGQIIDQSFPETIAEILLKKSTDYVLKFTNDSATEANVGFNVFFYESGN